MSHMKRFLENVNEEIAFLKRGIALYEASMREADKSRDLWEWEREDKKRKESGDDAP